MAVVTNPTAIAGGTVVTAAIGAGGFSGTEYNMDTTNGNKLAENGSDDILVRFRNTTAGAISVNCYADINGQECVVDVISVQGNGTQNGEKLWRPPRSANVRNHGTSIVGTPTTGIVLKQMSGTAGQVVVSVFELPKR